MLPCCMSVCCRVAVLHVSLLPCCRVACQFAAVLPCCMSVCCRVAVLHVSAAALFPPSLTSADSGDESFKEMLKEDGMVDIDIFSGCDQFYC